MAQNQGHQAEQTNPQATGEILHAEQQRQHSAADHTHAGPLNEARQARVPARKAPQAAASGPAANRDAPTPTAPDCVQASDSARYQPSKVFRTKCRAEIDALLENIKDHYHAQIRALYSDEQLADLFIQIGDTFNKPLHRCVLASRAFKLYCALREFTVDYNPSEQDIIISQFQKSLDEHADAPELALGRDLTDSKSNIGSSTSLNDSSEQASTELLPVIHCNLPEKLISPELLLNFARKAYLDQDLVQEETTIKKALVDWLKIHKPQVIKSKVNHSPDCRESFRTIRPDFVESSHSEEPPTSGNTMRSPVNSRADTKENSQLNSEEPEEASQLHSIRDGSMGALTRTETFELIRTPQPDDQTLTTDTASQSVTEDDRGDTTGDENADSETSRASAPRAPTTRTGLKPKTFTPINTRTRTSSGKTTELKGSPSEKSGEVSTGKRVVGSTRLSNSNRQTSTGSHPPSLSKRSSLSSQGTPTETNPPEATARLPVASIRSKVTPKTAPAVSKSAKPTPPITRAHPISLERSPATNSSIKGIPPKNFIAANKRLVSQMDKKSTANSPSDHGNYDSESEVATSEAGWPASAFEPLLSENMTSQLDKFALVSLSKLADALSRMFIGEILTDSLLQVADGKQVKAHKCILAARSPYLNEIISKRTELTAENLQLEPKQVLKIELTEFSYSAVYFSILHIYSGIVKVPEDLDLDELTKLSNLLHVSTLRQVCQHNLRMNYCHFFHKPCPVCSLGVLKTLPLAWRYDYTELYSKCLQWIGSHFANIFSLREFSELQPNDLIEECYSATMGQLTPDNIIGKTVECQKLLKNLPRVKWTESIICLVGRLLEDFCHYVADNYEKILQSESFMHLSKNCWECEILEENLLAAMNHLKPDSGCRTLTQLHKIECSMESFCGDPQSVSDSFSNLISKMRKYCERYLLKDASAVVHCSSWRHMNPSLQKRIKDQAIISSDFDEPTKPLAARPKLAPRTSGTNQSGGSSIVDGSKSPSARSTPESRLKSPSATYLPPPKNKVAAARHVKVLK